MAGIIHQQAVGELDHRVLAQITQIPWGHNIALIANCKDIEEALYYASIEEIEAELAGKNISITEKNHV